MVIAFLNQKGGTGKTTLSINIAHSLVLKNNQVLLVDADPQGSARDWAAARKEEPLFSVIGIDRPVIHKELPAIAGNMITLSSTVLHEFQTWPDQQLWPQF